MERVKQFFNPWTAKKTFWSLILLVAIVGVPVTISENMAEKKEAEEQRQEQRIQERAERQRLYDLRMAATRTFGVEECTTLADMAPLGADSIMTAFDLTPEELRIITEHCLNTLE